MHGLISSKEFAVNDLKDFALVPERPPELSEMSPITVPAEKIIYMPPMPIDGTLSDQQILKELSHTLKLGHADLLFDDYTSFSNPVQKLFKISKVSNI
jgi:hypothetical protein